MILFAQRAAAILYSFIKSYPGLYLIPANVCPIVPLTFNLAQIPFRFVDINKNTLCIDEDIIIDQLSKTKCAGIVFVRTYGHVYETDLLFNKIKLIQPDCKIIDDKCLCLPNFDELINNNVDLVLYSTGYAKQIELGYGGYAYINKLIEKAESKFIDFDIENYYKRAFHSGEKIKQVSQGWLNTDSIDNINEYKSVVKNKIIATIAHKTRINNIYKQLLPQNIILDDSFQNWRFNIIVENKIEILNKLFENGLYASSHYKPCNILFNNDIHVQSVSLHNKIINLFNDFHYTEEQAQRTCDIINQCV